MTDPSRSPFPASGRSATSPSGPSAADSLSSPSASGASGRDGTAQRPEPDLIEPAKTAAADLAAAARDGVQSAAETGRGFASEHLTNVAAAAEAAADELDQSSPQLAGYARQAARSVSDLSEAVTNRGVGDLLREANAFARREPVAFFGATLLAGFAAARFLAATPPSTATTRGAQTTRGAHDADDQRAPGMPIEPSDRRLDPAMPTTGPSLAGNPVVMSGVEI